MEEQDLKRPAENLLLFGEDDDLPDRPAAALMPEPEPVQAAVPDRTGAPVAPPSPAAPEPVRQYRVPAGLEPSPEFGAFLKRVREANGLPLAELSRQTRIKQSYLDALERESYSELPAIVYALAYVKVLAGFYGMDENGLNTLCSDLRRHFEYEAPKENKSVVGVELSEENQVMLKRILLTGAAGLAGLTILITLAILFFTSGKTEEAAGPSVAGGAPAGPDENRLVEMQPAPALQMHILPVPRRR